MKSTLTAAALTASLLGLNAIFAPTGSLAQEQGAEVKTGFTQTEIENIVRNYLLSNPELLLDVQNALEQKMQEQQMAASQKVIAEAADEIFKSEYDAVIGNPEGDVTVVEFFDYNCGYCKRALSDMEALVQQDKNLRFVLKEFPILGPDSQRAHLVAMAFHALAPDKYSEFHRRLLGSSARATEESAFKLALELGADEAALRNEMANPRVNEIIAANYELANMLQISGTPSYVVGEEVVRGALGKDVLTEKIQSARQ